MHDNELKHIGNQLFEMSEKELNTVLLQYKSKKNYQTTRKVLSRFEEIMKAEYFDYYGNIDEVAQYESDKEYPSLYRIYDSIYDEMHDVTKLFPLSLEITTELLDSKFLLKHEDNSDVYFRVGPMVSRPIGKCGSIEYKCPDSTSTYKTIYTNIESFSFHLEEWLQTLSLRKHHKGEESHTENTFQAVTPTIR